MNFKTSIGILRILALVEGISFLSFLITMPLKYGLDIKAPNKIVGMLHGFLFIAYCIYVFIVSRQKKWGIKNELISYAASLIPFATFWVDSKIFKVWEKR